jgi:hypothetical protein
MATVMIVSTAAAEAQVNLEWTAGSLPGPPGQSPTAMGGPGRRTPSFAGPRKASRVAEFGGDRQCGEIIHASETAEALDARPQRLEGEQRAQILFDAA